MDYSTVAPAAITILAAILGAIVAHVYRDYRDRPILRFTVESVRRARRHLQLPSDLHDRVRASKVACKSGSNLW